MGEGWQRESDRLMRVFGHFFLSGKFWYKSRHRSAAALLLDPPTGVERKVGGVSEQIFVLPHKRGRKIIRVRVFTTYVVFVLILPCLFFIFGTCMFVTGAGFITMRTGPTQGFP